MADRGIAPQMFSPKPIGRQPGEFINGPAPVVPPTYTLRGVTKDAGGAVLGGVTVDVFRSLVPHEWIGSTLSDANGNYSFNVPDGVTAVFAVSYLDGATPVAGTTLRTLVGV
jgi:hypothetical protein